MDVKKLKTFAKVVETKNSSTTVGRFKNKFERRTRKNPSLKKLDQKPVALAKLFLTKQIEYKSK